MMQLEQENNVEATTHETDMFHWVEIALMILSVSISWYALASVCIKDLSTGKDAKWLMVSPFLALVSFYIFRDAYRLAMSKK